MTQMSFWKYGILAGLAVGLMQTFFALISYFGIDSAIVNFAAMLLTWLLFIYALWQYANRNYGENFTFAKGMKLGVVMAVTAGIFSGLVVFAMYSLDDNLTAKALADTMQTASDANLPQDKTDILMEQTREMLKPSVIMTSQIFSDLLVGIIVSLITMVFVRNNQKQKTEKI